jgi:LPS export ABC transporter protein LptC
MSPRRLAKLLAWLGSAVLAVVMVATVWVVHNRKSAELLREAASVVPNSLLSAHSFHWTQMKGDKKQWELSGRVASYSADKKLLKLLDANLTMLTEDGKLVTLRAPKADLTMNGNRVSQADLSGGLEVHYGDVTVVTQQASFVPDSDQLSAPGPVAIQSQGLKVNGVGLTAHPRAQQFELLEQVTTEVTPRADAGQPGKVL